MTSTISSFRSVFLCHLSRKNNPDPPVILYHHNLYPSQHLRVCDSLLCKFTGSLAFPLDSLRAGAVSVLFTAGAPVPGRGTETEWCSKDTWGRRKGGGERGGKRERNEKGKRKAWQYSEFMNCPPHLPCGSPGNVRDQVSSLVAQSCFR